MKKYIMIGEHIFGAEDIARITQNKDKGRIEIHLTVDETHTLYAYPKGKESLNTYFDRVYQALS